MAEPDLSRELSSLADHPLPVTGLPAAEVRRRGDRLRRRNQALTAIAAAAAVAVIATTGALAGGAFDRAGAPQPAPPGPTSPSPSQEGQPRPDEIPGTFPIDAGLGEPTDVSETPLLVDRLTYCGEQPLAGVAPLDALSADHYGGETSETRTLLLFRTEAQAAATEERLLTAAGDCPSDRSPALRREVLPATSSWPGRTVLATFPSESGGTAADIHHVVHDGRALLLTSSYRGPDDVDESRAELAPLVEAMAELTGREPGAPVTPEAPPTEPVTLAPTGPQEIPEDFPLASGWDPTPAEPGGGIRGPSRTLAPLEFRACGETLSAGPDSRPRDVLRASSSSPEDYRERQLSTYPDATAAVAATARIVEHYRACPVSRPPENDGFETTTQVRRLGVGGESWAILDRDTFDGAETPFGSTMVVVRLGRAVLVLAHGGHVGYPSGDGTAAIDELVTEAATSISAMCRFTEAGC